MESRFGRTRSCLLFLAIAGCVPTIAGAGDRLYRIYGYQPRVYGYAPSDYVFPRYGFQRGYVYVEGPPYGSPELGPPALCRGQSEMSPLFPGPPGPMDYGGDVVIPAPPEPENTKTPATLDGAARSVRNARR